MSDGSPLGALLGLPDGISDGISVGSPDGSKLGDEEGRLEGNSDGNLLGSTEGSLLGISLGSTEGSSDGRVVGTRDGDFVGRPVVGATVGRGDTVGMPVGTSVVYWINGNSLPQAPHVIGQNWCNTTFMHRACRKSSFALMDSQVVVPSSHP